MLFSELRFLAFFAVVFAVHWTLRWAGLRKLWLLVASYAFYAGWDWRFLGLILCSTVVDYGVGRGLAGADPGARPGFRRGLLIVSLAVNLGLLGFFKYYNFFAESAVAFSAWMGLPLSLTTLQIVLPVGISFYTFQTLSYTLDVYRGELEATRRPLDFALFVAFFPQLVAGPIVRAREFLPQLSSPRRLADTHLRAALLLFLYGFVKKTCVADNFGLLADQVFAAPETFGVLAHWLALALYCVQIYCDFSGYSDMAIATAALLGYRLPLNFNFPYLARSVAGFWRRWHISLSSWFRDYLYLPLGGSRAGRTRVACNLLLTFTVSGLWHGASWNFVLWGGLHGVVVALEFLTGWNHEGRRSIVGIAVTNWVWAMSMVLFRTADLDAAGGFLAGLFGLGATGTGQLASVTPLLLLGWFCFHIAMSRGRIQARLQTLSPPVFAALYGALVALALPWVPVAFRPFIYFQF